MAFCDSSAVTTPHWGDAAVHLDNLALVPASLLPFKAQYQHLANTLPKGDILIILPATDPDISTSQ
jgi:hypothetical protein